MGIVGVIVSMYSTTLCIVSCEQELMYKLISCSKA